MDIKSKNYTYFKSTKIIVTIIAILSISLAAAIFGYSCSDNVSSIEPVVEANYINSYEHLKEVWDIVDKVHVYRNPHLDEILYYTEDITGNADTNIYNNEPFIVETTNNYINNFGQIMSYAESMYKFIKSFNTYYIINREYGMECGSNSNKDFTQKSLSSYFRVNSRNDERVYVAFTDKYINQKQEQWTFSRNSSIKILTLFTLVVVTGVISLIWLMYVTGIDAESENVVLYKIDYIHTDIIFIVGILLVALWVIIIKESMPIDYINNSTTWFTAFFDFAITMIFSSILIAILLSLTRRFKTRTIIENSTIYSIFNIKKIKKLKRHGFYKALFIRQLVFVFLEVLVLVLGLLPIVIYYIYKVEVIAAIVVSILIALIYITLNAKSFNDVEILIEHIDQIYAGNLEYKSTVPKKSLLYDSSKKLENIGEGLQKSVEHQIKNEKMKMDLITNVSHDLKTPLTSIISYIDLLSKEKNISEEERDYIRILAQKSDSLKNIVADLFDLAKVTSGNSEIELEEIDMHKLIIQTLADMEDKIDSSKYIIKTVLPDSPAYVLADGKKMYRVFQNVIDNALKYSLTGTRIFIESEIVNDKVNISIKNTASYEMDFTEDEILERFSRGDKSRTTDGNGLGLSIAQSFTQACRGQFKILIDGDQFKVSINFDIIK